jgi:thiol-disulfide isomerase/thioredoxin
MGFVVLMRRIALLASAWVAITAAVWAADFSQFKTADELWDHIQKLEKAEPVHDQAQFIERIEEFRSAGLEFENRYPKDPRRWEVKLMRVQAESIRAQIDNNAPTPGAILAMIKEVLAAPDAPLATKADARYLQARVHMEALDSSGLATDPAARAAVNADVADLRKEYPDDTRTGVLQFQLAQVLKLRDPAAAESILRELEGSQNIQLAAAAQQQLDSLQFARKLAKEPLDLKFQAVDGTQIDMAKLRGKVVLVDFWATWCGPCRMEIPNVVATYTQLHDRGFEIVGVSLDQDKDKLLNFTKQAGMTWPEYFDAKGWKNDISSRYGVSQIPSAWLVDKKGFVRSTEARGGDLAGQVKALLAE